MRKTQRREDASVKSASLFSLVLPLIFVTTTLVGCVDESKQNTQETLNLSTLGESQGIFGGEELLFKDPWVKSLVSIENPNNDQHNCTGTLIHKRVILTAAHCVWDEAEFIEQSVVKFLSLESGTYSDSGSSSDADKDPRPKKVVIPDPYYDLRAENPMSTLFLYYDVAVILLDRDAPEGTEPLPLVKADLGVEKMPTFWSAGYGAEDAVIDVVDSIRQVTPLEAGRLRKAELTRNPKPDSPFWLQSIQDDSGTCYGDSGAPALALIDNKWQIVGLSSFVKSKAKEACRLAGYFVNLGHKVEGWPSWSEWINSQIKELTESHETDL